MTLFYYCKVELTAENSAMDILKVCKTCLDKIKRGELK